MIIDKYKKYCIDCNNPVQNKYALRCWSYYKKLLDSKRNFCIDCGKEVNKYKNSKRCRSCEMIRRHKENILKANGRKNGNYKIGQCLKQYYCKNCKKKISLSSGLYGKNYCKECVKSVLREKGRKRFQNNEFCKNFYKVHKFKQNKSEKFVESILKMLFNNTFKYVGDGYTFIGGKCPDFINFENKIIIEFYGQYWHKTSEEKERIKHFKKYNYDTLIIWDYELKDIDYLVGKLLYLYSEFAIT